MRELNKRQRKLLDAWILQNRERLLFRGGIIFYQIEDDTEFSSGLLEELEKINDHETIIQNINRYVSDKVMGWTTRG